MPNSGFVDNYYSKFNGLSNMPYKIITYLLNNNENLWKMLNYSTADCLMQPNLTKAQKAKLIYNGQADSTLYRMFMLDSTDDIWNTECAIVRVYEAITIPTNRVTSVVHFQIDAFCHNKINQMSNYQPRTLRMKEEILATLNGSDIGGVGLLSFDQAGSRKDISMLNQNNDKGWSGYSIVMHTGIG